MLAKGARLAREEVATVLARGLRFGDSSLSLLALTSQTSRHRPKFAVIVPAKQVPLAVSRHLIKRRVRSVLRALAPELSVGLSLVVFCGATAKNWTVGQLAGKIKPLFAQAKLFS